MRNKTEQNPLAYPLKTPKAFALSWMINACINKDDAPQVWEKLHENISCPLPGILVLLGPYKWLLEFGTNEELEKNIRTLTEAENIVNKKRKGKEDDESLTFFHGPHATLLCPNPKQNPPPSEVLLADVAIRNAKIIGLSLTDAELTYLQETAASPPPLLFIRNGLRSISEEMESCRIISARAEEYLRKDGWKFQLPARKLVAIGKHKGRNLLTLCIFALSIQYGRDKKGRAKIKQYLSPIFSINLDDGRRGNIARALENARRGA